MLAYRAGGASTNGLIREHLPEGAAITSHELYRDAGGSEFDYRLRAALGFLAQRERLPRLLLDSDS